MLHRIDEQHKVHYSIDLVVFFERVVQDVTQGVEGADLVVERVIQITRGEMTINERVWVFVGVEAVDTDAREKLLRHALRQFLVLCQVLVRDKNVTVHALRLVQPHPHKLVWILELLRPRAKQPGEDAREVPDIELVVEIDSSLPESLRHLCLHR